MRTAGPLTAAKITAIAIEFVDRHGLDALTLRSLGDELGVKHTAMYRHFANKNELLAAMFDWVITETIERSDVDAASPRARVESLAFAFRSVMRAHPTLVPTMISSAGSSSALQLQDQIVDALRAMGVPDDQLPTMYQALETHVFGSVAFDFAAAPRHLSMRQARFAQSHVPAMQSAAQSDAAIEGVNESAFALTLALLLDTAEQRVA